MNVFKLIFKLLLYVVSAAAIWFALALLLPKVKLGDDNLKPGTDVTIFVRSNGTHTDIVMPRNVQLPNSIVSFNWSNLVPDSLFAGVDSTYGYVAVGWGDKGFYLNTPEWKDLKVSTAVKAAFGLGGTAMHVTYYKNMRAGESTRELTLSAQNYQSLISEITQSFDLKDGLPTLIPHPAYGNRDNYFEAKGSYSLFKTCNVWTGNTLRKAHVPMGIWTPLSSGVMNNLHEIGTD